MSAGNISAWLGIFVTLAVGVARFASLEEARINQAEQIVELKAAVRKMNDDKSVLLEVQNIKADVRLINAEIGYIRTSLDDIRKKK